MDDPRIAFWRRHYARPEVQSRPWLDLSNEAVQAQTFSLALEAAGTVRGKRCLDVGCGWGRLSVILDHLGASAVTGVDQIAEFVDANRRTQPGIQWMAGNVADPEILRELPCVDLLFAVEILQYVPFATTVASLWDRVGPGGRLIGVVPNRDCLLVQSTATRFEGLYEPPSAGEVRERLEALPGVERWAVRELTFQIDQRLVPYDVGPWSTEPAGGASPNRFLFAAVRRGGW